MAKITPEELVQNIQEFIQEDLKFDPPQSRRFYTTNIFQRTLAHIVGWTPWGTRMLRCTSAGELKTAPTTTGIEEYTVSPGTGTDTLTLAFNVGPVWASRVDFFIWDKPAVVTLYIPEKYGPEIEIPVGFYSIDCRVQMIKLKNKTEGQTTRFQIVGWW